MARLKKIFMWFAITVVGSVALGSMANALADRADDKKFPAPGVLLKVGDYKLHINCKGSSKLTLLLEAGAGGSSLDWYRVYEALSKKYRVCAYDRAGFGWSDVGPSPRDSQQIVLELDRLLRESGENGPLILAGHSFGGLIVRHFTRKYPNRVKGVILVDSIHEEYLDALPEEYKKQQASQFVVLRVGAFLAKIGVVRAFGLIALPPNTAEEMRAVATSHAVRARSINTTYQEGIVFEKSAEQMAQEAPFPREIPLVVLSRNFDVRSEYRAITDQIWHEHQLKLTKLSNNSTHLISKKPDHYIQLSEPELVVQAADILFAFNRAE